MFAKLTEAARPKKPAAKAVSPVLDGDGSASDQSGSQTRKEKSTSVAEVIDVDEV